MSDGGDGRGGTLPGGSQAAAEDMQLSSSGVQHQAAGGRDSHRRQGESGGSKVYRKLFKVR